MIFASLGLTWSGCSGTANARRIRRGLLILALLTPRLTIKQVSPLWLTRHILFNFSNTRKNKQATPRSLIGLWKFVYPPSPCWCFITALWDSGCLSRRDPWQPGRPRSPQKCAFNWVTSYQAVKYSGGVNKTGQQGTRTQPNHCQSSVLMWLWPARISLFMNNITGSAVFCVIEFFLRLHQLGEEACLWCVEITGAEKSHQLRLNTY